MEQELKADSTRGMDHARVPKLEPGIKEENDNMPRLSKLQIELMVSSFAADFARVATFQITNSVGDARMHWLGINEGHHQLSHEPDSNAEAVKKLTNINKWYCEQLAYLAKRLAETPEPGGERQPARQYHDRLDQRTRQRQLAHARQHPLRDDRRRPRITKWAGRSNSKSVPHNRLLLSLAHSFGHELKTFGNPDYCGDGPLSGLS